MGDLAKKEIRLLAYHTFKDPERKISDVIIPILKTFFNDLGWNVLRVVSFDH